MPKGGIVEKESWVKHFRNQIKLTCSDNWYVTNNRGRIRLKVEGVGSISLPYDWSEKGAALAIDRISSDVCSSDLSYSSIPTNSGIKL